MFGETDLVSFQGMCLMGVGLNQKKIRIPGQTRTKKCPVKTVSHFGMTQLGGSHLGSLGKYIAYKLGCDENDGNGPMATILGASCTPRKLLSTMARLPGSSGLTQSVSGRLSSRAIGVTSP